MEGLIKEREKMKKIRSKAGAIFDGGSFDADYEPACYPER